MLMKHSHYLDSNSTLDPKSESLIAEGKWISLDTPVSSTIPKLIPLIYERIFTKALKTNIPLHLFTNSFNDVLQNNELIVKPHLIVI